MKLTSSLNSAIPGFHCNGGWGEKKRGKEKKREEKIYRETGD